MDIWSVKAREVGMELFDVLLLSGDSHFSWRSSLLEGVEIFPSNYFLEFALQLWKTTRCLFSTYAYLHFIKPRYCVRKDETILSICYKTLLKRNHFGTEYWTGNCYWIKRYWNWPPEKKHSIELFYCTIRTWNFGDP